MYCNVLQQITGVSAKMTGVSALCSIRFQEWVHCARTDNRSECIMLKITRVSALCSRWHEWVHYAQNDMSECIMLKMTLVSALCSRWHEWVHYAQDDRSECIMLKMTRVSDLCSRWQDGCIMLKKDFRSECIVLQLLTEVSVLCSRWHEWDMLKMTQVCALCSNRMFWFIYLFWYQS